MIAKINTVKEIELRAGQLFALEGCIYVLVKRVNEPLRLYNITTENIWSSICDEEALANDLYEYDFEYLGTIADLLQGGK